MTETEGQAVVAVTLGILGWRASWVVRRVGYGTEPAPSWPGRHPIVVRREHCVRSPEDVWMEPHQDPPDLFNIKRRGKEREREENK